LGVHFVERCFPSDAIAERESVSIATNTRTFRCKIVVDGTGRSRWLARRWRLNVDMFSTRLIARYGYWKGDGPSKDQNPTFISRSDGWDWIAQVRPDLLQWISLRSGHQKSARDPGPRELRSLKRVGSIKGADVTWSLVRRSASPEYFLVGDAAAVLDPSSSHGLLRGLSSGILAATCIKKILDDQSKEAREIAAGYDAWLRNSAMTDMKKLAIRNPLQQNVVA
jgi:flavin-dependent dehydrogenase